MTGLFSWHKKSIRRRLLLWGLALLFLALAVNTVAGSIYTRRQIKKAAAELQADIAIRVANRIRNFVGSKQERLSDLSISLSLHPFGSGEQRLLALLLLKNEAAITEISILDAKGMEVVKVSERKLYIASDLTDQSAAEKYKKAIKGEPYISRVYTSDKAEPYLTLAVPIRLTRQQMIGVVSAEANLKTLWQVIGETRFGGAGYAYLVDGRGNLIAHRDPSLVLKRTNLAEVHEVSDFLRHPTGLDTTPASENTGFAGKPVLSTHAPVRDLGWGVILEEPLDVALAEVKKLERYAGVVLGLGLFVGTLIIMWFSGQITEPIRELHRGATFIGRGHLDHRVFTKSEDEIGELAHEFNKMAADLKTAYTTLEERVEQRTIDLSALYRVTSAVNQSLDLDKVLHEVIDVLKEIFGFDATRVFLFNGHGDELRLKASSTTQPDVWAQIKVFKRGQGIVGMVAESGKPIVFENIETDCRYRQLSHSQVTQKAGFRFFAVFPVKAKEKSVGVMVFIGKAPRRLESDEERLLTSVSEQIGVAVERASIFDEAVRRAQRLSTLHDVATTVSQSLDVELVLRQAVEKVAQVLRFDAVWIFLVNAAENELEVKSYYGLSAASGQALSRRKMGEGVAGRVATSGEAIVFEDIQDDPRYVQLSSGKLAKLWGFRSMGGFPIRAKGKMLGVLSLASHDRHRFPGDELEWISSIASEIGVSIENAALFEEVSRKTAELEKAYGSLQEASRAKSEFMAAMSHELRTPLNVIVGNADLAKDGFFGEVSEQQKQALEKILRYSSVLLKLINDVLTLTRIEAKKMSFNTSSLSIEEIVGHAKTHVEQLNRDRRLEVVWNVEKNLPRIMTDGLKLEEILQNLIGNAFKFTSRGGIQVSVRDLRGNRRIEFSVADTGIGIKKDDLERIFDEFHQLDGAHTGDYSGVGLGLSIVKKYLDLMHGDIHVKSEPGAGSTFTFTLPYEV
ncbi:MAG: GAF domain-containing protein [Deltaproteobacteria bacterium]|nr:GAF domain-containing protein [Deltaproteobacteria bacterium]